MKSTSVQRQSIHSINGAIGKISTQVLLNLYTILIFKRWSGEFLHPLDISPSIVHDYDTRMDDKIGFLSILKTFPPFPPNNVDFSFFRQHKPQCLHNIELRGLEVSEN